MDTIKINHSDEPIRLFKSDFLEFFTHISPVVVVIIWLPVAVIFFIRGILIKPQSLSTVFVPFGFILGLFLWTLAEYLLHRFLFHYKPKTPQQEKIFYLFHGVHHEQPQCKTRLVMPPVVSIPLALVFFGIYHVIFAVALKAPFMTALVFSGFIIGYLLYDITHYATHHWPMRSGFLKALKRHHMRHHYKTPNQRFGVSSPLWDYIFGTQGD
jgi:sterol desaturase/sphingolipid hydroxylase (fatty acid hydroxylase superfamily)